MSASLQDAVVLAPDLTTDAELETAISVTSAECKYAESVVTRTKGAYETIRHIGTQEQYREAERAYAKARDQLLDALARLADLRLQASNQLKWRGNI
jgi:hypothetical protein